MSNNESSQVESLSLNLIENYIVSDGSFTYPIITTKYPFVLDGVAFVICKSGEGKVRINFKEYTIRKNTIITVLPYFIVEFLEKKEELDVEFLVFSIDFISSFGIQEKINFDISQKIILSPCLDVSDEEIGSFLNFHSFIVKHYKRKTHLYKDVISRTLLYALMLEIGSVYMSRENPDVQKTHQEKTVNTFFKLLVEHHRKQRSVSFYADKMCLTPKYLTTLIKKRTGKTMLAWINNAVIVSAKYMLKTTSLSVAEISDELNFPNPSFFGALFKKMVGMTPLQYRNS